MPSSGRSSISHIVSLTIAVNLSSFLSNLVFTFKNKIDQIVAGGVDESPMMKNETAARAIWGGTGKYFGVRGQLVTTLKADGNYTDVFTILR